MIIILKVAKDVFLEKKREKHLNIIGYTYERDLYVEKTDQQPCKEFMGGGVAHVEKLGY